MLLYGVEVATKAAVPAIAVVVAEDHLAPEVVTERRRLPPSNSTSEV